MSEICDCNENQMIIGNGELFFCPNATTKAAALAKGFLKFCSIDEVSIEPDSEIKKKITACRGAKRTVKSSNRMMGLKYKLKLNELGPKQLGLLYFADENYDFGVNGTNDNAQAEINDVLTDITGTSQFIPAGAWIPILTSTGAEITNITNFDTVTDTSGGIWGLDENQTALVEGHDYTVDKTLGMIRFRKDVEYRTIQAMVTCRRIEPTQSQGAQAAPSLIAAYMRKIKPYSKASQKGLARLVIFDDDATANVALKHMDFYCEITATSGPTFGDDFATLEVEVEVLDMNAGDVFVRPDLGITGFAL